LQLGQAGPHVDECLLVLRDILPRGIPLGCGAGDARVERRHGRGVREGAGGERVGPLRPAPQAGDRLGGHAGSAVGREPRVEGPCLDVA